jgi:hypothetical protein
VGPVRVVMLDVLGKDCFEVTVAEGEHPVEALAPDSAHDPLADRVRSGCPDRALDDPGALCGEDGVKGGGDGSTPWRFRIAQTLEGAMTTPMVASSPWMRR